MLLTFSAYIFVLKGKKMNEAAQKLVLTIPSAQMARFLEVIRQFDFIKVESLEEIINRYLRTAPKQMSVSDDEISDILMEVRYGKASDAIEWK